MPHDANRSRSAIPRPSSVGHRGSRAFAAPHGDELRKVIPKATKDGEWIAEALNEAVVGYLAAYAIHHPTTPSEQARWNERLRKAADECLAMMAPRFSPDYPPHHPIPEVFATLFHNGAPEGIKAAHLRWMGFEDEWVALDKITDALWLLRTFAANAETKWQEQTASPDDKGRKQIRYWLRTWVSDLGRLYAMISGSLPTYATDKAPFVRFAEAARLHVLTARESVTDGGTDADAYAELAQFDVGRLRSFIKRHLSILKSRWQLGLERGRNPARYELLRPAVIDPPEDTEK